MFLQHISLNSTHLVLSMLYYFIFVKPPITHSLKHNLRVLTRHHTCTVDLQAMFHMKHVGIFTTQHHT
jgi:hypothetical protein